ncbi:MAG TPA: M28 family peptidase [Gaiellaceae bacterium]|nr:M28 family peptidase [Gaiellaceae bacterium]
MYRGTWLLVGLPLLLAAFSVARPEPLPSPPLPPTFDQESARLLTEDLVLRYPRRAPGDLGPVNWVVEKFRLYGFRAERNRFSANIPGLGRRTLTNVVVRAPGRSSRVLVVTAHRDDVGAGQGADDNASGTAALVELARAYAQPEAAGAPPGRVRPSHTILFVSTDGGAYGAIGAAHLAAEPSYRDRIAAVISLDSLAGRSRARLVIDGDRPRTSSPVLVRTASERVLEETGEPARRDGALAQLLDLAFPYSTSEQAPFVARGVAAVTLTTSPDRAVDPYGDTAATIDANRLGELGRAAQQLLLSLDQGIEPGPSAAGYLYLGDRMLRGWALQLVLVAMTLPFLAATVDLFARCRRRRIALGPAWRSLRTRLVVWAAVGLLFALLGLVGAWPDGIDRPIAPHTEAAGRWPVAGLVLLGIGSVLAWVPSRPRLVPRRPATAEEELAGHTVALLALGLLALLVVVTNAYGLLLLLPALHAWLWLPQIRDRPSWLRGLVLLAGLAGPLLLVGSFAIRYGLGLDAPWYLAALLAVGYVPAAPALLFLGLAACTGQLAALAAGRYAPYQPVTGRGPLRELVRRTVLAVRARRAGTDDDAQALGG